MHRLIKAIAIFWILACCTCCTSTRCFVFGVPIEKNKTTNKYEKILAGVAASIASHVVGHYLAAEYFQVDIYQDGFREGTVEAGHDQSDLRWVSRGGFFFQTLVNTALVSSDYTRDTYFTKGFTATTFAELATYPIIFKDEGDFNSIDGRGGDGDKEWGIFSGIAAYNLYRTTLSERKKP